MRSLGERLLELRERYVKGGGTLVMMCAKKQDEFDAILFDYPPFWNGVSPREVRLVKTVAIERAAVRELRKEGKL